jgi:hypothetical protein
MAAAPSIQVGRRAYNRSMDELRAILERVGAPADIAATVEARATPIIRAYLAEMRERRPKNPGLTVPLADEQKAKLQAFYDAYERAALESLILAVVAAEMPPIPVAGGKH